jgi:hypothetical protein
MVLQLPPELANKVNAAQLQQLQMAELRIDIAARILTATIDPTALVEPWQIEGTYLSPVLNNRADFAVRQAEALLVRLGAMAIRKRAEADEDKPV